MALDDVLRCTFSPWIDECVNFVLQSKSCYESLECVECLSDNVGELSYSLAMLGRRQRWFFRRQFQRGTFSKFGRGHQLRNIEFGKLNSGGCGVFVGGGCILDFTWGLRLRFGFTLNPSNCAEKWSRHKSFTHALLLQDLIVLPTRSLMQCFIINIKIPINWPCAKNILILSSNTLLSKQTFTLDCVFLKPEAISLANEAAASVLPVQSESKI